eukprot:6064505-Amphidinium_carterae.1
MDFQNQKRRNLYSFLSSHVVGSYTVFVCVCVSAAFQNFQAVARAPEPCQEKQRILALQCMLSRVSYIACNPECICRARLQCKRMHSEVQNCMRSTYGEARSCPPRSSRVNSSQIPSTYSLCRGLPPSAAKSQRQQQRRRRRSPSATLSVQCWPHACVSLIFVIQSEGRQQPIRAIGRKNAPCLHEWEEWHASTGHRREWPAEEWEAWPEPEDEVEEGEEGKEGEEKKENEDACKSDPESEFALDPLSQAETMDEEKECEN